MEEVIEQLKKDLEAVSAKVSEVENIGSKDFVRTPDREFKAGIFVHIDFNSPAEAPQALHERLRLNKSVDRVIVQAV